MKKIKVVNELNEYIKAFMKVSQKNSTIPVFINTEREDLQENILLFEKLNNDYSLSSIFKSDYGLIISNSLLFYKESDVFCKKWCDLDNFKFNSGKSLVILGIYEDFTQAKLLKIINYCRDQHIQINFLIGRDLPSLSWFIAKQFIQKNKPVNKAIFSLLNLKNFGPSDWNIFGAKDLEVKNIKKELLTHYWSDLVFHGHGKEDHLNLDDFTISSLKNNLKPSIPFAPSIGHKNQSFFKDINKSILIKRVNVDRLYVLSCNNFPFYDSRLYDSKYNIILDSIDGLAKNIMASISVQSADTPELEVIMKNSTSKNLSTKLNDSLSDIDPMISIIQIGLPEINADVINSEVKTHRLTSLTRHILSRVSSYSASTMLNTKHSVNKLSRKVFEDYMQHTSRGTAGCSSTDMDHFETELVNRINPLSKKMADIMLANPNDELHSFDNFNTYRAIIDPNSIFRSKCTCGGSLFTCKYEPEVSTLFPIVSSYCYKCGDKSAKMIGMPEVRFSCDNYNSNDLEINYKIEITAEEKGDVFFAVQLPNYVANYVKNLESLHKMKFKTAGITKEFKGTIKFKKDTILQSYYLKLFIVQNAGIEVNRCFFNLI